MISSELYSKFEAVILLAMNEGYYGGTLTKDLMSMLVALHEDTTYTNSDIEEQLEFDRENN